MSPHAKYLIPIIIAGSFAWASVALVIYRLDPYKSTQLALTLFFVSLFIALICTFTLLGYFIRTKIHISEIFYSHINVALRQGILLSVCSLSCIFLLVINALTWWSGLFIVLFITMIEVYASSQQS